MFNKKIPYLKYFPIIILSLITFKLTSNFEIITNGINSIFSILSPFIWGFGIAFLINPLMVFFEKKFRFKKILSILISYSIVFGVLIFITTVISPNISSTLTELFNRFPNYISLTNEYIIKILDELNFPGKITIVNYIKNTLMEYSTNYNSYSNSLISFSVSIAINLGYYILNFFLGIIISIYMLNEKENIKIYAKKVIYALFKEHISDNIIDFGRETTFIFTQFIMGKFIDSIIVATLCFVGLLVFNFKYALLISLIVGITNMIPYFGKFIAMFIASFLTFLDSPDRALWISIFIFVVQQLDGLFITPKILSDKIGLTPLMVIFAIIIGGNFGGILGLFISVPCLALFKVVFNKFIEKKLKIKERNSIK